MKLTAAHLASLKLGQKLWLHDNVKGVAAPKPAVMKKWDRQDRFLIHVLEDDRVVDSVPWSLDTNGPVGQFRMKINPKIWLTLRD